MNNSKGSSLSRNLVDPVKNIRPVLSSRKKTEPPKPESKSFIDPVIKGKKSTTPLKNTQKVSRDFSSSSDSNLVAYKVQRDLRFRNQDPPKPEKKSLKEIEKLQENIRSQTFIKDTIESRLENKAVSASKPFAKSTKGLTERNESCFDKIQTVAEHKQSFSEKIAIEDNIFSKNFKEMGSIKDRICKRMLERLSNSEKTVEFVNDVKFFDDIRENLPKTPIINEEANIKRENDYNKVLSKYINHIETIESVSDELTIEDANQYMPEIPLFNYNSGNSFNEDDYSEQNEYFQNDIPFVDILESNSYTDCAEIPQLVNTLEIIHEIYLDLTYSRMITTAVNEHVPILLPVLDSVCFFVKPKIQAKNSIGFTQEDFRNVGFVKPKIISISQIYLQKKPEVELEVIQQKSKIVRIIDFLPIRKPKVEIKEIQVFAICRKLLGWVEICEIKATTKINSEIEEVKEIMQENIVKTERSEEFFKYSRESSKDFVFESRSSLYSEDRQGDRWFLDSQNSLNLNSENSYKAPEPLYTELQNSLLKLEHSQSDKPSTSPQELNNIIRIQSSFRAFISRKHTTSLKLAKSRLLRKKESALYILFSIFKKSYLYSHFSKWLCLFPSELLPETYLKFIHFSATFIQRNWRGFFVRKYIIPSFLQARKIKAKLRGVLISWKTRKIFSTKRMKNHIKNLKDLKNMISELTLDEDCSAKNLLPRMLEEVPKMHSKLIKDFNTLYRTGTWTALLPKLNESSPSQPRPSRAINRDEIPIRPLQINYNELPTPAFEEKPAPKKVFSNFLKRKTKPLKDLPEKSVNATEESKEKVEVKENYREELWEIQEETMQDEKRFEGKPKEFLKRKSQAIRPKKVQWKVQKKIDCWVSKEVYSKKSVKAKPESEEKREFLTTEELEVIFEDVGREYVDTSSYLKRFERVATRTRIPQFKNCSEFLFGFREDTYYDMLEELESHYLLLCNQGFRL